MVLFAGYAALVGTLAEELSKQIIRLLSITLAFMAGFALLVGIPTIALRKFIQRRDSSVVLQTGARLVGDIIVLLCILPLLLFSIGVVIALLQLSTGQFLFGNEETQYRHLMMLSAYAGAFFGTSAGWKSKTFYGLSWAVSIWHGARVFLEAAFLSYAGLWLSKGPFEYAATQVKDENWEIVAITLIGIVLIFAGSLSLMVRQSQMRPEVTENVEQISFRTKVRQQIQDLKSATSVIISGVKKLVTFFRK